MKPVSGRPARFGLTVCTRLPPARWLTSHAWKWPAPQRRDADEDVHDALFAVALAVHALVAEREPAVARIAARERAALLQRRHELAQLSRRTPPGGRLVGLEDHPARAALDAVDDEQREAPGRERAPVRSDRTRARERAGFRHFPPGPAHGLDGVYADRGKAGALVIVHRAGRAQPRTHHGFLAARTRPHRPVLGGARQHAGDGAGRREGLEPPAQLVVAEQAREEHACRVGRQRPVAHLGERLRGAVPRERRVDEQDRATFTAEPVGDEQRARADVHVARERRDAQQVEAVDCVQCEQPGAARGRADDVVVRERRAVVGIRSREHVAGETARVRARSQVGPCVRQLARDARERGLRQHGPDRTRRIRDDGHATVDLLVLDVLGARRAHALDDEVEAVLLVVADAVVVDGGAQELAGAGCERLEHERPVARRQPDGAAARAVRDAHDDRRAAAVLEVLLDGVRQRRRLPEAAEDALELVEAGDADGPVDGTTQAAADKGRYGRRCFSDRLPGAGFLLNLDAGQSFRLG